MRNTSENIISLRPALLWLVLAFVLCLRLVTLGELALTDPSEGRYAVIGQDMLLSGDWLTPHTWIGGRLVPFLGKPPLHTWATAASYSLLGVSEFSARFPSFLASAIVAALSAYLALQFFGVESAIASVLLLLSSWLFFFLGSSCLTDPLLMLSVMLSMFSLSQLFLFSKVSGKKREAWELLFFSAIALGMLVKGPIAAAIPIVAISCWSGVAGRFREVLRLQWLRGGLFVFLLVAPWYLLAERANPGFLWYFLVNENLLRFFVRTYGDLYGKGHVYTYGTIWLFLALGFLPGSLFLLLASTRRAGGMLLRRERSKMYFLLFWAISPAIIFTFSRQVSPSYVLPGIPALAIFIGAILSSTIENSTSEKPALYVRRALKVSACVLCGFLLIGLFLSPEIDATFISLFCVAALAFAVTNSRAGSRASDRRVLYAGLAAPTIIFAAVLVNLAPILDVQSSSREIVEHVEQMYPGQALRFGFLEEIPYSALFYSREPDDRISLVDVNGSAVATTEVPFLVARRKHLPKVPPKILSQFHEIGSLGRWVILARLPGGASPTA